MSRGRWTVGLLLTSGLVGCSSSFSECPDGQELCGSVCADVQVDRNHCGACGNACGAGQICNGEGQCALSCTDGLQACDGTCVDSNVDPRHCGACSNACAAGEVCDGSGRCAVQCTSGLAVCEGSCVDPQADARHCGECGVSCAAGEACVGGSCEPSCGADLVACGGGCVDPRVDSTYCGASGDCTGANQGTICSPEQACVGGGCRQLGRCELPPSGGTADVTVAVSTDVAVEGAAAVTYSIVLDRAPCDNVYVMLAPNEQLRVTPEMLVFTPESWNTAQTVEVWAVHDFEVEGEHVGSVAHTLVSGDVAYHALAVGPATVAIADRAHLAHLSVPLAETDTRDSERPAVSDDGRFVAFLSEATNLVLGDTNGARDAFVRDMIAGTTRRVSVSATGEQANGATESIALSSDGEVVAFFSWASNLVAGTSGEVYRVSVARSLPIRNVSQPCTGCNQEMSPSFAMSGDGRLIAFTTRRQLLPADPESEYDVYTWHEDTQALTLDSTNSTDGNGVAFWGSNNFDPTLSATGRFVGFASAAWNLALPEITVQNFHSYVKDRADGGLRRMSLMNGGTANCDGTFQSSNSWGPHISTDGDIAAFTSACAFTLDAAEVPDTNGVEDVYVRRTSLERTFRVSVSSTGEQGNGSSRVLGISDDGRYVMFVSSASNLVPNDENGLDDLFVHDVVTRTTRLVSVGPDYGPIATGAVSGAMSRNGRFVAIVTTSALLTSDLNPGRDVYLLQLW